MRFRSPSTLALLWPLLGSFLSLAAATYAAWHFFPPNLQIDAPMISHRNNRYIITSRIVNHMARATSILLRFKISRHHFGRAQSGLLDEQRHQDTSVIVPASDSIVAACEFPDTDPFSAQVAEVQMLSSQPAG